MSSYFFDSNVTSNNIQYSPNVFPQVLSNGTAISLKSAEKYERCDLVTTYFLHPPFFYRHLFSTQGCT